LLFHRAKSFFRYLLNAKNAHGIHSPFIYELYTTVIRRQTHYYAFEDLLNYRKKLAQDYTQLSLIDLGAGPSNQQSPPRYVRVKDIYKRSGHTIKDTSLLFKLALHFKPQHLLELGTCLGVSTLYLAKADPKATVYTLEGNPDYATHAREAFIQYQSTNIVLIEGNIHHTLGIAMDRIPSLDFAFIDAHHAFEPTLHFFKTCLTKAHENTVIVLDDIHWSPEMERAWEVIKQMEEVKQTVDLFQFGLVFFKSTQAKEHFVLRYF